MCPNRQERQATVIFVCGAQEEITGVAEPEVCHYEFEFSTPTACTVEAFKSMLNIT